MTIREKLGLPKGESMRTHPVYRAIANGRNSKKTIMTSKEFVDKYLNTWRPGLAFNWETKTWLNNGTYKGAMTISTVIMGGTLYYRLTVPGINPQKYITRKNKDELITIRNDYIIDNNLLGIYTLL